MWIEAALAISDEEAIRATVWLAADLPATRALKESVTPPDWPAAPLTVAAKAAKLGPIAREPLIPEWFRPHCPAAFESSALR